MAKQSKHQGGPSWRSSPGLDYDKDFVPALEKIGLDIAQFARETGYDPTIVYRWRHRVNGVPHWVRSWLQLRDLAARWHRLMKQEQRRQQQKSG